MNIFERHQAIVNNIYKSFVDNDIEKGKKMPIGTISNGRKKVAEGKWVEVKETNKFSKEKFEEAIKNKNAQALVNEAKKMSDDQLDQQIEVAGQLAATSPGYVPIHNLLSKVRDKRQESASTKDSNTEGSKVQQAQQEYDSFMDYAKGKIVSWFMQTSNEKNPSLSNSDYLRFVKDKDFAKKYPNVAKKHKQLSTRLMSAKKEESAKKAVAQLTSKFPNKLKQMQSAGFKVTSFTDKGRGRFSIGLADSNAGEFSNRKAEDDKANKLKQIFSDFRSKKGHQGSVGEDIVIDFIGRSKK